MKSTIVTIAAGVGGLALGFCAGWFLRKRQEVVFEEITEEEQQKYAAQFGQEQGHEEEDKKPEVEVTVVEQVPMIQVDQEGTNVSPAMDTRKVDYANAWKRDEIIKRESYGEPSPGEPEDLDVSEKDIDPDFLEEAEKEGPRFVPITQREYYDDKDKHHMSILWYDRDDVVTRVNDDESETEISDPRSYLGFDIRHEYETARDTVDENAGYGLYLYREDRQTSTLIQMVRYPMFYGKRKQQEEYGGTDYLDRIHRHGSIL